MPKIKLSSEVVDLIAIDVLKEHLGFVNKDIKKWKKEIVKGSKSEIIKKDIADSEKIKIHIEEVLAYFGVKKN